MASPAADRLSAAHRRELSAIGAAVTSGVFSLALGADPFAIDLWFTSALDGLITKVVSGHAQARRSTVGYLTQHAALSGHSVRPVPASIDMGQVRTSLRVTGPVAFKTAIGNGASHSMAVESMARQLSGSSSRLALGGDRDTFDATLRSPRGGIVGYRRRLGGRGCGFCSMLASRGAVYHSEASAARTRDGQRYHDHCRCSPEPLYVREQEPPEVRELQRQWQRVTAGHHGNGAVRAWERHWEGKLPPGQIRAAADLTRSSLGLAAKEAVPGEGLAPAFHVELRPALAKARSTRKVEQVFLAEARRLTGRDIPAKFHHHDVDIAADHAEGILRVLAEFPDVEVASIRPAMHANHPNAYAVALTGSRELLLNPRYATDSVGYRESLRRAGGARFHLRGETTPVGTGAHEMAHIVHHQYDPVELRRTVSRLIEDQADAAGMDIVSYVKQEIGDYAVKHIDEMIAAAVADALTSGAAASRLSQGVLRLMRDQYARGRALTAPAVVRASEALDYSKLTVPQLKDIAAARGITVPARARKADILALLESGPLEGFVPTALSITDRAFLTQARADLRRLEADRAAPDRLAAMERAQRRIEGAETRILAAKRRPTNPASEAEWSTARARAADDVGKALSELDEMVHAAASARAIETRLTTLGHGLHPDLVDDLIRAGRLDRAEVNAAIDVIAERHGLVRITGRSGDVEPFDPAKHEMAGRGAQPPVGSPVRVFRPAWAMKDSDRQLSRASVSVADDAPSGPVVRGMTPDEFDARITRAATGERAEMSVPVRVEVDASSGSDTGRWKAFEVTGLEGSPKPLLSAITSRVRVSGMANQRLRTPEGRQMPDWEVKMRASYTPEMRARLEAADAERRAKDIAAGDREIRALDRAMEQSKLTEDAVLWRGAQFSDFGLPDDAVGFEWTDLGYVGTSSERQLSESFLARDPVMMRILAPRGTGAIRIAGGGEGEVLLQRGLRFRVVRETRAPNGKTRVLDLEIVPDVPIVAPVPAAAPAVTSTKAAVARQAAIDKARAVGDLGADVLEQLENGMTGAALRTRITQTAARLGTPNKVRDALLAAVDDPAALRQAVAAALRTSKIDIVAGDAGTLVRFDRRTMQAIDGTIPDDAHVLIIKPGLSFLRGKERIQISRATVEVATPEEVLEIERRATRAAARVRQREIEQANGTANLLAEMDELIARKADPSAILQRLDPALIARDSGSPFAGADPAVLTALRDAAADAVKLKAAVTRLSTKAKIKAISRSGAKVKFDPDTMDALPGAPEIKAGTPVTIVTRGSTVTLPDGTVMQLRKAVATPVAKPVKATKAKAVPSLDQRTRSVEKLSRQTPSDTRQLGGGQHADVDLLTYPGGPQAVRKVFGRRSPGSPAEIKREVDAEILAPTVADAVGLRAPGVVSVDKNGVLMEFIEGETFAERFPGFGYGDQGHWARIALQHSETDDGRMMGLADYLMGNVDRNEGNWMFLPNGRYAAIDHGYAFTGDLPHGFFGDYLRDGFKLRAQVDLNPADLAVIRRRLEALLPRFLGSGRKRWHDDIMRRLGEVEKRADPAAPIRLAP